MPFAIIMIIIEMATMNRIGIAPHFDLAHTLILFYRQMYEYATPRPGGDEGTSRGYI